MSDVPRPPIPPRRRPVLVEPDKLSIDDVSKQLTLLRFDMNDRLEAIHGDIGFIKAMLTDQASRVSAVEKATPGQKAAKAGKYGALLLAVPALLQLVSELSPKMAGPLQQIAELFK